MKLKLLRSTTSKITRLFIQDTTLATGAGLIGLTSGSAGITAYYLREGDPSATAITLSAGTVGTWSSGGFVAADAANLPGLYEMGLPNAALASGNSVVVMLKGAANMAPTLLEVELDAVNYQDAAAFGLTRLDVATSTRSTFAGGAVASVTGAVGSVTAGVTAVTVSDKTGYTLTSAEHTAISGTDVPAALTAQGYTSVRAGYLDALNGLVAAVWAAGSRTLTAFAFTVAASNPGLTTAQQTELDAIKAKTDTIVPVPTKYIP